MFRGGASALLYVLLGLIFPVYAGQGEGDTFKLYLAGAALPGAWRLAGRLKR